MPRTESHAAGTPCWAELSTTDAQKSKDFYTQLFGWEAEERGPEYGGYISFSLGGAMVAGCMQNDGSMGPTNVWSLYLASDDAAATTAAITANGGQVVVEPMAVMDMGTMAFAVDPTGAAVGAWQAGTHPGFQVLAESGAPAWFELHTRDHAGAVKFYESAFGWDVHSVSDTPEFRYATLGEGDEQKAGIMDSSSFLPDDVPAHWAIYFAVEDADTTLRKVTELGGTVVQPAEDTPYGRLAVVSDSTGAQFRVVQDL